MLAAAGIWRWRLRLADALVRRAVAAAGMAGTRVRVAEIGAREARLVELRAGEPPAVEAAEITLRYSLGGLLRARVGELELAGVRVHGRLDGDGFALAGEPRATTGGDGGAFGVPPVDRIRLRDARVELATPAGAVVAAGLRGELALPGGRVGEGELAIGSLETPLLAPLALSLRTSGEAGEGDAAGLPVHLEIAAGERELLSGDGRLRADPPGAELALAGSLVFARDGLQPRDLAPAAAEWIASAAGALAVRARASAGEDGVALALHVETEGLDLATPEGVRVEGLAGKADLRGPAPIHTPEAELLRFRSADLIGPFEDGALRWRLRGTELEVLEAAWSYAGGRLSTAGRFDLLAAEQPFTVEVAGVSLGRLLEQLDLADLSGSGRLSGSLPLVFDGESFRVSGGTLSNDEAGVLRYAPAGPAAAGLGGDLEVLVGALEELHYEKLRLTLDGALGGDVRVTGEIRGRNPRYEAGRPVELNVTLEANLPALLRGGRAVTEVPEVIERRLRGRVPAE